MNGIPSYFEPLKKKKNNNNKAVDMNLPHWLVTGISIMIRGVILTIKMNELCQEMCWNWHPSILYLIPLTTKWKGSYPLSATIKSKPHKSNLKMDNIVYQAQISWLGRARKFLDVGPTSHPSNLITKMQLNLLIMPLPIGATLLFFFSNGAGLFPPAERS